MNKIRILLRKISEILRSTHSMTQLAAASACLGILLLVLFSFIFITPQERAVFFFPEVKKGKVSTEIRYLPSARGTDARLNLYVSELLLGPMHPEYLPLYSRETQVRSAFIRKHIAYIDISADALSPVKTIVSQEKAYELFKKNVCTNYRNIDKIYLYIDGIEVYPETPIASAKTNKKR
jgi:hypothetical protein